MLKIQELSYSVSLNLRRATRNYNGHVPVEIENVMEQPSAAVGRGIAG